VGHDYISFGGFRLSRLFLGLFFGLDCVWGMLLYTGQKRQCFCMVFWASEIKERKYDCHEKKSLKIDGSPPKNADPTVTQKTCSKNFWKKKS